MELTTAETRLHLGNKHKSKTSIRISKDRSRLIRFMHDPVITVEGFDDINTATSSCFKLGWWSRWVWTSLMPSFSRSTFQAVACFISFSAVSQTRWLWRSAADQRIIMWCEVTPYCVRLCYDESHSGVTALFNVALRVCFGKVWFTWLRRGIVLASNVSKPRRDKTFDFHHGPPEHGK